MKNDFKIFVEAYHKKNFQVRNGGHDSTYFPTHFLLETLSNY